MKTLETSKFNIDTKYEKLPAIMLRGICIMPGATINLSMHDKPDTTALNAAAEYGKVLLVSKRERGTSEIEARDMFPVGVVCEIQQYARLSDNSIQATLRGLCRAEIRSVAFDDDCLSVSFERHEDNTVSESPLSEALMRTALSLYNEYTSVSGSAMPEISLDTAKRFGIGSLTDFITQNSSLPVNCKQELLGELEPVKRIHSMCKMMGHEIDVATFEHELNEKFHQQLAEDQKENILREQLSVIQNELGEGDTEIDDYRQRILALKLDEEIQDKLLKEVVRLSKQFYNSPDASIIRTYLDAVLALPWNRSTKEKLDLKAVRKALDRDHYGLDKVKDRIIEYLAVRKMTPDIKGGILCLAGPPGIGKTSIAISIAGAINRKLARMSLGGVHDEAEIRGHRKTYVGAMPGRIMEAVTQAGSKNPLLLLDEIDKLGNDYKGDPASALLEALDPEQNKSFIDHFLEIPFDLSEIMFITTANTTDTIPRPLLDRMEVIELSSYTDEEKLQITKNHLLPKTRKKHGLDARRLKISDDVIREIISGYTRESGVRQLEREIAKICRKTDVMIVSGEAKTVTLTSDKLESFLGVRKYKPERLVGKDCVGVVNGLAWTSVGGELLEVEVSCVEGSGKVELTGNLGDVMKESAQAAISYIRGRCGALGIDKDFYKNTDIHIHFPEGAVPKDGPSAGITIAIAVISALTGKPVRRDLAMTGELTLTGRILPIGGLKEKTMAAYRYGVKTVIIPAENESDLEEIDQSVRQCLNFITTSRLDDVLPEVLKINVMA